jgi:hypothetical protein
LFFLIDKPESLFIIGIFDYLFKQAQHILRLCSLDEAQRYSTPFPPLIAFMNINRKSLHTLNTWKCVWLVTISIFVSASGQIRAAAEKSSPGRLSVTYCTDCVPFHFRDDQGQAGCAERNEAHPTALAYEYIR